VIDGDQVERAIAIAESKLGYPYVWATAGPDSFDCSGFAWYVASQVLGPLDYELRSSHHQFNVWGEWVAGQPVRGDLVFFDVEQGVIMGNLAGHVGFALGDGRMIHAANERLGVRYDELANPWYAARFIGARRVFVGVERLESASRQDGKTARELTDLPTGRLADSESEGFRVPRGPIRTAAPWNGEPIGADWSLIGRWTGLIEDAAAEFAVDPRHLAAIMAIETQGLHERAGQVLEVWDDHPEDGPSVGVMQVKPRVWSWLRPDLDPYTVAGNIRLGAAVLRHLLDRHGSFEAAIAGGYHPGESPNGTTPGSYVLAARSLLGELDEASRRTGETAR
jgi:hypothetical protein